MHSVKNNQKHQHAHTHTNTETKNPTEKERVTYLVFYKPHVEMMEFP